jgi:hypothetical protein
VGVWVIQLLQWWSIPRRGWIIILAELGVIVTLASWVYSEYVNNTYFQSYVNGLSPILLPIVSVGFGITSATIATLLYFTMRNIRQRESVNVEEIPRSRGSVKRTVKKQQFSPSRSERTGVGGLGGVARPKSQTPGTSRSRPGTTQVDSQEAESA